MQKEPIFKVNVTQALIGLLLVAVGVFVPSVISYGTSGISYYIQQAAHEGQSSYVLIAALRLVMLNSLRSFPHYLGAFLVIKAIRCENRTLSLIKTLVLSVLIVLGVYFAAEKLYDIRYNFVVSAMLMLSIILVVDRLDFTMVSIGKEVLMLAMFIVAIQFLDTMPGLPAVLFGRGEIASYIKNLSVMMDCSSLLQSTCMLFMLIFAFFAFILWMQISLENQLRKSRKEIEDERERLIQTRLRLRDARANKEKQYLVHDLKAPLTSLQIWTDLIRMKLLEEHEAVLAAAPEEKELADAVEQRCLACGDYVDRIDGSINHMNLLISELMNSKAKNIFSVSDVIKLFSSQTSPAVYNDMVEIDCTCPNAKVEVNRTNFVRALINLTENSSHAIHHDHGKIKLSVTSDGESVAFTVSDNGEGIPANMLDEIWQEGVSGNDSTGFGLFFVKEVVNDAGGRSDIVSTPGEGTAVTLTIPCCE